MRSVNAGKSVCTAARTYPRKTPRSLSSSSRETQATGAPRLLDHSCISVVLPEPAGAQIRVRKRSLFRLSRVDEPPPLDVPGGQPGWMQLAGNERRGERRGHGGASSMRRPFATPRARVSKRARSGQAQQTISNMESIENNLLVSNRIVQSVAQAIAPAYSPYFYACFAFYAPWHPMRPMHPECTILVLPRCWVPPYDRATAPDPNLLWRRGSGASRRGKTEDRDITRGQG